MTYTYCNTFVKVFPKCVLGVRMSAQLEISFKWQQTVFYGWTIVQQCSGDAGNWQILNGTNSIVSLRPNSSSD